MPDPVTVNAPTNAPPHPLGLPAWAVLLAAAGLVVPIVVTIALPTLAAEGWGPAIWLVALVTLFTLTHYRGIRGAVESFSVMVLALVGTHAAVYAAGLGTPNFPLLALLFATYLLVAVGFAMFEDLLRKELHAAEALALVDPLTQLPNRRHAELALDREFAAGLRGRQVGVVIYDVDFFKQFNDRYGHAAGDDVLRTFAEVLRHHTRRQNLSARYGGEEFITVVSDVDLDGMLIFANRVREAIKSEQTRWGTVTVSAGVAVNRDGMGSYEVLVASADRALYAAKRAGRDRVEAATDVERRAPSAPRAVFPSRPKRVLVVDDDPKIRKALVTVLQENGYETQHTGGVEEAARLLKEEDEYVDVLVTSLVMPRLSGFTLVDRLSTKVDDLRVVYLSESMRERVSWSGVPGAVTRFVRKPVEPSQLVAAVREAIEERIDPSP